MSNLLASYLENTLQVVRYQSKTLCMWLKTLCKWFVNKENHLQMVCKMLTITN